MAWSTLKAQMTTRLQSSRIMSSFVLISSWGGPSSIMYELNPFSPIHIWHYMQPTFLDSNQRGSHPAHLFQHLIIQDFINLIWLKHSWGFRNVPQRCSQLYSKHNPHVPRQTIALVMSVVSLASHMVRMPLGFPIYLRYILCCVTGWLVNTRSLNVYSVMTRPPSHLKTLWSRSPTERTIRSMEVPFINNTGMSYSLMHRMLPLFFLPFYICWPISL